MKRTAKWILILCSNILLLGACATDKQAHLKDQEDGGLRGLASGSNLSGYDLIVYRGKFANWLQKTLDLRDIPVENIEVSFVSQSRYSVSFFEHPSSGTVRCKLRISLDTEARSFSIQCSRKVGESFHGDLQEAGFDIDWENPSENRVRFY